MGVCLRALDLSDLDDADHETFSRIRATIASGLADLGSTTEVTQTEIEAIGSAMPSPLTDLELLALTWAIHDTRAAKIAASWLPPGHRRDPHEGELIPLPSAFPAAHAFQAAGIRPTAAPKRANPHGPDELPSIRRVRAGPNGLLPHFDASRADLLTFLDATESVAAVVLNATEVDFDIPNGVTFPVTPKDPDRQHRTVVESVREALEAGCQVIVLPELSVPAAALPEIVELTRRIPCIVMAGSRHEERDGRRTNISTVVLGAGASIDVEKRFEYATADHSNREAIQPPPGGRLHVLVGEGCRVAPLICRDGVGAEVGAALVRWGVNVGLIAAWSPSTSPFESLAETLAVYSRGVTVAANNPLSFHGVPRTSAVVGRPSEYLTRVRRLSSDTAPAVISLQLTDQ